MDSIEKRARELLAAECSRHGFEFGAYQIREGSTLPPFGAASLNAIIAALTPPEGYMLVPLRVLQDAYVHIAREIHFRGGDRSLLDALVDALAARPEVP